MSELIRWQDKDLSEYYNADEVDAVLAEKDKTIKDIVKGASSMFREFKCCRGLDTKSPLGKIADVAYKHWMRDWITENENEQLKDEKDRLLYSNRQLLDRTFQLKKHVISQDRQIRRQKYKRCLAMAKWCAKNVDHLNSEGYIYEKENHLDGLGDCIKGTNFYHKWYKRWLQIAEAYK